eukprot:1087749-Prymnesium_polylepis.1
MAPPHAVPTRACTRAGLARRAPATGAAGAACSGDAAGAVRGASGYVRSSSRRRRAGVSSLRRSSRGGFPARIHNAKLP